MDGEDILGDEGEGVVVRQILHLVRLRRFNAAKYTAIMIITFARL